MIDELKKATRNAAATTTCEMDAFVGPRFCALRTYTTTHAAGQCHHHQPPPPTDSTTTRATSSKQRFLAAAAEAPSYCRKSCRLLLCRLEATEEHLLVGFALPFLLPPPVLS